ncbi:hypothetical protein CCACVL1_25903 [Corchorus capsularis]|uniref:Uncharacterized protein n=1 Tax=Corchorus capsularis TaxID=210143 RepID=A0A1R3GGN4_COCAP|nr:hypothetical protein CCACVL1_25903 [Corchorus capsularis]
MRECSWTSSNTSSEDNDSSTKSNFMGFDPPLSPRMCGRRSTREEITSSQLTQAGEEAF